MNRPFPSFSDYWNLIGARQKADIFPEDFARRAFEYVLRQVEVRESAPPCVTSVEGVIYPASCD